MCAPVYLFDEAVGSFDAVDFQGIAPEEREFLAQRHSGEVNAIDENGRSIYSPISPLVNRTGGKNKTST